MRLSEDEFKARLREKDLVMTSHDILFQLNLYYGRPVHDLPAAKRGVREILYQAENNELKSFREWETRKPEAYDLIVDNLYKCFAAGVFQV